MAMQELKTRRIAFHFDDDVPFDWNPGNPAVGNATNYGAVIAPAFERYFVKVTRDALRLVDDPEVVRNAQQFCAQEGTHSRHHRSHMAVLLKRYPGLQQALDEVEASYDRLYEERDLEFHLAYMAVLEGWFGPLAILFVDNREVLFGRSDPRIASFVLWHLIEEFEHRSSAHALYRALVPSQGPLLKAVPSVVRHIAQLRRIVLDAFLEHVPEADNPSRGSVDGLMKDVRRGDQLRFYGRLLAALLPGHDPARLPEPSWASRWFRDEEAGRDMTLYFPAPQVATAG